MIIVSSWDFFLVIVTLFLYGRKKNTLNPSSTLSLSLFFFILSVNFPLLNSHSFSGPVHDFYHSNSSHYFRMPSGDLFTTVDGSQLCIGKSNEQYSRYCLTDYYLKERTWQLRTCAMRACERDMRHGLSSALYIAHVSCFHSIPVARVRRSRGLRLRYVVYYW